MQQDSTQDVSEDVQKGNTESRQTTSVRDVPGEKNRHDLGPETDGREPLAGSRPYGGSSGYLYSKTPRPRPGVDPGLEAELSAGKLRGDVDPSKSGQIKSMRVTKIKKAESEDPRFFKESWG